MFVEKGDENVMNEKKTKRRQPKILHLFIITKLQIVSNPFSYQKIFQHLDKILILKRTFV